MERGAPLGGEPAENPHEEARIARLKALHRAEQALERGDASGVAEYLRETPCPDRRFLLDLAYMMVPGADGDPNWRVEFHHRRRGNPMAARETEIRLLVIGAAAESLYYRARRWPLKNKASLRKRVNGRIAERFDATDGQVREAVKFYRKRGRELGLGGELVE
jgi:hypothetical protein